VVLDPLAAKSLTRDVAGDCMLMNNDALVRKVIWKIVPLLALIYLLSFLDRVNIGFAALTMNADLHLTANEYGRAAGLFFGGYILFAVPANLAMHRWGAKLWISTITIVWGLVSLSSAFVSTPTEFYVVRFLLGSAESGFLPAVMLYFTYWFPPKVRGRIVASFFSAAPLSNVVGAPVSGWLLNHSIMGLKGWQSMFLLEALPTVAFGIVAGLWLSDGPQTAKWLSATERNDLRRVLDENRQTQLPHSSASGFKLAVWILGLQYFLLVVGLYGFGFWAPLIFQSVGHLSAQTIGLFVAIPYLAAALCMYVWSRHSDRHGERFIHLSVAAFLAAAGFLIAGFSTSLPVVVLGFVLATCGIYSACAVFWTLPSALVQGAAAASAIGFVNSLGNIAGYVGPAMMGELRTSTGGYSMGINVMAISLLLAAALAIGLRWTSKPVITGG